MYRFSTSTNGLANRLFVYVFLDMSLGAFGLGREDAMVHLLNYVWPNIFETSPHVINAVMEAIEGMRMAVGPTKILQYALQVCLTNRIYLPPKLCITISHSFAFFLYLCQGLFHPARKVRNVYWKIYNTLYISAQDPMVSCYPRLCSPIDRKYRRWELEMFL